MTKFKIISIMLCSIIFLTSCSITSSDKPADNTEVVTDTPVVEETVTTPTIDSVPIVNNIFDIIGAPKTDIDAIYGENTQIDTVKAILLSNEEVPNSEVYSYLDGQLQITYSNNSPLYFELYPKDISYVAGDINSQTNILNLLRMEYYPASASNKLSTVWDLDDSNLKPQITAFSTGTINNADNAMVDFITVKYK